MPKTTEIAKEIVDNKTSSRSSTSGTIDSGSLSQATEVSASQESKLNFSSEKNSLANRPGSSQKVPVLLTDSKSFLSQADADKARIKNEIERQRDYLKYKREHMLEFELNPQTLTFELDPFPKNSKSFKVEESAYKMVDISGFDFYEGREITILPEFASLLTIDNGPLPPVSDIYKFPLEPADFCLDEWSDLEEESYNLDGPCKLDKEDDGGIMKPATAPDDVSEDDRMECDEPIAAGSSGTLPKQAERGEDQGEKRE